jgi:putative ABC transport system substrate-binding protein
VDSQLVVLRPAAESRGVFLIEVPAENVKDIQTDLAAREKAGDPGMDAILIIAEPLAVNPEAFAVFGKYAAEHRIPVGGAIMSVNGYESIFGVSTKNSAVGVQAAVMADKIFRGTPAGVIPVVSAENYFQINYRAAQELGLKVSEGILSRADEIIR